MTTLQDYLNNARVEENNDNVPQPEDCADLSVDDIVTRIICQVNMVRDNGDTSNKVFYAGICKDVKDNMHRHGNDRYVALVNCGSRDKSGSVEETLGELGFDVGERANNGGDDESVIVYVIKKDRNFKR